MTKPTLKGKEKKYQIIYADPPWKQSKGGLRSVRPNQDRRLDYPTLNIREIKNYLGKIDADIMFLWTIDRFLYDAEQIAKDLGYKLHARLIWDKENGVAPAFTIRFSHEYLLWFYKRNLVPIENKGKYTTVIREKATRHSQKPEKAYEFIESIYPNKTKIELFARNRRDGWSSWGNEIVCDVWL